MHKMLTRFLAVAALLCAAGVASATQYPNATCPDSVTIKQIQDITATCHVVSTDTVAGVAGIITGFDPIASGFDAYIQNSQGGPFSGIDFFTHAKNTKAAPWNYAIGDSIVVEFAAVAEFQGATEVLAANNSFGSPNFVVRRASSGNALPPFFVGTTTQLVETPTNTFAEQYEGCLVRIVGGSYLTVVRTSLTGGLGQNNGFLMVDSSAPSDSVFVDGNKLTTFAPPAVGSQIASVQGIMNQNVRGYRIMLRNGNDIVSNTPPDMTDAYPLTDNTVKVVFDRDITTATGTDITKYTLGSFGSVTAASMITQLSVQLTINNGLAHGINETVTVNGITGLAAGQTMTTPESRTFINGVLTAEEVQRANPDSMAATVPPCADRSRFAGPGGQIIQGALGTRATMAGTSGAIYGTVYYIMDPGNPVRGGVAAFAPPATLTVGRKWRLTGQVQEFFGETEFSNIIEVTDQGAAVVPTPRTITVNQAYRDTCDYLNLFDDGEDHEGTFVTLPFVKVVQRFPTLPTNGFHVADQSFPDTIFVENFNTVLTPLVSPTLGHLITVTGVLHYSGGSFRVCPRNYSDIVDLGVASVPGSSRQLSFSVYPNPARTAKFNFSLPEAEDVEIGIYDVAGRQVATLFQGRLPAGSYARDWTGTDGSGRTVGAGVFFARMKAGGQTRAIRTVYLGR